LRLLAPVCGTQVVFMSARVAQKILELFEVGLELEPFNRW